MIFLGKKFLGNFYRHLAIFFIIGGVLVRIFVITLNVSTTTYLNLHHGYLPSIIDKICKAFYLELTTLCIELVSTYWVPKMRSHYNVTLGWKKLLHEIRKTSYPSVPLKQVRNRFFFSIHPSNGKVFFPFL